MQKYGENRVVTPICIPHLALTIIIIKKTINVYLKNIIFINYIIYQENYFMFEVYSYIRQ